MVDRGRIRGWSLSRIGIGEALQRKCACDGCGSCEACKARENAGKAGEEQTGGRFAVQRKAVRGASADRAPPIVHEVLRSSGMPLDPATRGYFESRMGYDFSRVRVHSDAQAAQSARAVNALAYTVGGHVVFGEGRYAPGTTEGRGLLAHELTHTIQQSASQPRLDTLSLDRPGVGACELEAERVRAAIEAGTDVGESRERVDSSVQRVPGSPAGGCGVCYGTPKAVGTAAHVLISNAFKLLNPTIVAPLPLVPSPTDDNGVLDLAVFTGSSSIAIGEIKPANPRGLLQGDSDLFWYEDQLVQLGFRVSRLRMPPPVDAIPFPTLAEPPCPPVQDLFVDPPVHGIYTYWCIPDFSKLIGRCPCKPPEEEPKPVPTKAPQKAPKKEKVRNKKEEKQTEPVGTPGPAPIPGKDLAPVLIALAVMGAVAAKMKKAALGRAFAYVTAVAVIVLLASGAEASVGLKGDDPLESLFKLAEAHGQTIPDDIKEKMRKDPRLKEALSKGIRTGDFSEAQRQAGEQIARVIADHADEFTDEEVEELLRATEGVQGSMPGGRITVQELRHELAAKKSDAAGKGTGTGTQAQRPTGSAGGRPRQGAGAGAKDVPSGQGVPSREGAESGHPSSPAERLVEAMAKGVDGPVLTPRLEERLLDAARAITPPLTDQEVDQLARRLGSATGKSEDEIVDSIRTGVAALRSGKPGGPGSDTGGEGGAAAKDVDPGKKAEQRPGQVSTDQAVNKLPQGRENEKTKSHLEKQFGWIDKGVTYIEGAKDLRFVDGKPFVGFIIGRDAGGAVFLGRGSVTPRLREGSWTLEVPAGIELFGAAGRYGTTRKFSVRAFAGVGLGPQRSRQQRIGIAGGSS